MISDNDETCMRAGRIDEKIMKIMNEARTSISYSCLIIYDYQ